MRRRRPPDPIDSDPEYADATPELVALAQRIATLRGYWRGCGLPACKRARRCVGPKVRCLRDKHSALPVRVQARRRAATRRWLREAAAQMPS